MLSSWPLEPRQRRQLNALLIQLRRVGYETANGTLIFKTALPDVYYSKIDGNVALRPRCCIGPELDPAEYQELHRAHANTGEFVPSRQIMMPAGKSEVITYLERVHKKDGKEHPTRRDSRSLARLAEIQADRGRRQLVTLQTGGGQR